MDVTVINLTRSLGKPLRVKNCESFFCRLRGLMFQNSIEIGAGLLMIQGSESLANASIHMFFVGMDLGVVWLDSSRTIVDKQLAKSWQPFYKPAAPAQYILEIHPDRLSEFELGDILDFE